MADAKISALTAVGTPADTDEFGVNQGSVSKKITLLQVKTHANTAPVMAAGSSTAGSWPKQTSGTVQTTPDAGTFAEYDGNCFYGTTDAGNRGYIPVRHFIRCDSARTLPNDTATNAIFNSPTTGTLTLETGTYLFEMMMLVTGMSATSGNAQVLFGGTATLAAWLWRYDSLDNTTPGTVADDDSAMLTANASAASAAVAGTGTAMRFYGHGTFEVTGAGTIIPQIDQVTAAAASVAIGSYFMCERIGSSTVVSVGQWT
jgi:hypothetical protein